MKMTLYCEPSYMALIWEILIMRLSLFQKCMSKKLCQRKVSPKNRRGKCFDGKMTNVLGVQEVFLVKDIKWTRLFEHILERLTSM